MAKFRLTADAQDKAIGTRDPDAAVNAFEVPRAALDDVVRWEGF